MSAIAVGWSVGEVRAERLRRITVLDRVVADEAGKDVMGREFREVLGDTTESAMARDRLLHRSVVINLDGESYRLRPPHRR